jgi:hypothetical protein
MTRRLPANYPPRSPPIPPYRVRGGRSPHAHGEFVAASWTMEASQTMGENLDQGAAGGRGPFWAQAPAGRSSA